MAKQATGPDEQCGKVSFQDRKLYRVFTRDTPIGYVFEGVEPTAIKVANLVRHGLNTIGDVAEAPLITLLNVRGVGKADRAKLFAACLMAGVTPKWGDEYGIKASDVTEVVYLLKRYYVGEGVSMFRPRSYRRVLDLHSIVGLLTVLREEGHLTFLTNQ